MVKQLYLTYRLEPVTVDLGVMSIMVYFTFSPNSRIGAIPLDGLVSCRRYFLAGFTLCNRCSRRWLGLRRRRKTLKKRESCKGMQRENGSMKKMKRMEGKEKRKKPKIEKGLYKKKNTKNTRKIEDVEERKDRNTNDRNKKMDCPVGWGCRIHWLRLWRGVRPPHTHTTSVLDMTLSNLMARFQQCWCFGECGVPLHCHRSQVHSGPEW